MTSKAEADRARWRDILVRQYGPPLVLVCTGVWLHAADSLLVATMLPAVVAEIGGEALVAWTVALYEVGSIVAGAASGLLAIRRGVRLPMVAAALLFAVGCATSATAPAMWLLLIGRLLQGLGGGGLVALSFVAVGLLFPKRLIARAMAAVSTLWGISAFLGPLLGGLFVEFASWRGGFWFFALQALALATWLGLGVKLREKPPQQGGEQRPPLLRLLFLSAGVVLIATSGIAIAPMRTGVLVLAGLACLMVFLILDGRRAASRLLPPQPLNLRLPASAALTMILCFAAGSIAITAYGPLLMTSLHGASALEAGYVVACSSIGWTLLAVLVSGAPERHDPKFIAAGMVMVTASILGFAYSLPNGPLWLIALFAAMEGGGFGMAWTFILRQTTKLAPTAETERIAGAIPTVQRLGYALGAAYVGIVANAAGFADAAGRGETTQVATTIFLACLPFAALGLVALGYFLAGAARARRRR